MAFPLAHWPLRRFIEPMQFRHALLAAAVLITVGCHKDEVRVFEAPKDAPSAASPATASVPPAGEAIPAGQPKVPWTIPAGWEERANASGMRLASYGVSTPDGRKVDISVVALGEQAGTELDNVNRWRTQLKLEPVGVDGLVALRSPVKIGGTPGQLYDLVSDAPLPDEKFRTRILAAMLPAGGMTVFFKVMGADTLVTEQKPNVLLWLASVQAGGEREGEPANATSAPVPAPASAPTPASVAAGAGGLPEWQVPAGWKAAGPRPMRLASFVVPGEGASTGDVSISSLASGGGGLLANVNRWRGQAGLAPTDDATLAKEAQALDLAGGVHGTLVDLAGSKTRILGAVVPVGDKAWFFKLTGDTDLVGRERENFVNFVKSVKF